MTSISSYEGVVMKAEQITGEMKWNAGNKSTHISTCLMTDKEHKLINTENYNYGTRNRKCNKTHGSYYRYMNISVKMVKAYFKIPFDTSLSMKALYFS